MPTSRFRFGTPAAALVLAAALSPLAGAQSEPAPPRILALKGAVTVTRAGAAAEIPASAGLTLSARDRLATAGRARAEMQFDNRVFQLAAGSKIGLVGAGSGAYRVAVGQGTVTCHVVAEPATWLDLITPIVRIAPQMAGVYRVAVSGAHESQITALEGNVEVVARAGSAWVLAGQKLLARGPEDNPEFKIVAAFSGWRRFLSIAMMSMQVAADASAGFSGGDSKSRTAPKTAAKTAAKTSALTNSGGARAPSTRPPSASKPSAPSGSAPSASAKSAPSATHASAGKSR